MANQTTATIPNVEALAQMLAKLPAEEQRKATLHLAGVVQGMILAGHSKSA